MFLLVSSSAQKVLILEDLEDVDCLEGNAAVFKCRICPSDFTEVKWYLDETLLYTNDLNDIQIIPGGYHTLTIKQLVRKDTGTISFEAGDKRSYASLLVRGKRHKYLTVNIYKYSSVLMLIYHIMTFFQKDAQRLPNR